MHTILVATEKPFAKVAVEGIQKIARDAGFEVRLLEKYTKKEELLAAVKDVEAIIIRSDIIDQEVIQAADQLKIVVRAGAGYDNVDLKAASSKKVVVMNTPGQNANAVAELTFGAMVYLNRNVSWSKDGLDFLTESLRIEEDDLAELDFSRADEILRGVKNHRTADYIERMRRELSAC